MRSILIFDSKEKRNIRRVLLLIIIFIIPMQTFAALDPQTTTEITNSGASMSEAIGQLDEEQASSYRGNLGVFGRIIQGMFWGKSMNEIPEVKEFHEETKSAKETVYALKQLENMESELNALGEVSPQEIERETKKILLTLENSMKLHRKHTQAVAEPNGTTWSRIKKTARKGFIGFVYFGKAAIHWDLYTEAARAEANIVGISFPFQDVHIGKFNKFLEEPQFDLLKDTGLIEGNIGVCERGGAAGIFPKGAYRYECWGHDDGTVEEGYTVAHPLIRAKTRKALADVVKAGGKVGPVGAIAKLIGHAPSVLWINLATTLTTFKHPDGEESFQLISGLELAGHGFNRYLPFVPYGVVHPIRVGLFFSAVHPKELIKD